MNGEAAPPPHPSRWVVLLAAIRPRTLNIALAPVLIGTSLAWADGYMHQWVVLVATLSCALLIQIGTNLHNDVRDFERGTDGSDRVGPLRVTAAGWVLPRTMHRATRFCFAAALIFGLFLVQKGGLPILLAGSFSLLAGWSYSGGPKPVSHTPFGELVVLVFFGLVAVSGSYWLQSGQSSWEALWCGAAIGCPAAAVLMVNNYRDLEGDLRSGRRTLAAYLGQFLAVRTYQCLVLLPFLLTVALVWHGRTGTMLVTLALPFAIKLAANMLSAKRAEALNSLLSNTAKLGLMFAVLLSAGLFLK